VSEAKTKQGNNKARRQQGEKQVEKQVEKQAEKQVEKEPALFQYLNK